MSRRALHRKRYLASILLGFFALSGCGSDSDPPTSPSNGGGGAPGPTTSAFSGILIGAGDAGKLTVTIDKPGLAARWRADGLSGGARRSRSVITIGAHGVFSRDGASPVILEGTYHETMMTVSMQGGGYTISAHRVIWDDTGSTGLLGGMTGPNGDGNIYCFDSRSDSVRVYAGTFDNDLHSFSGKWNFATIDTVLIGLTWPNGSPAAGALFRGSIERTGDTRAIFVDDREGQNVIGASGALDVDSGAAAGTWTHGSSDSGIWSVMLVP